MRKILAIVALSILVLPHAAAAGYLVSDTERLCIQVPSNPGIGIGGFVYSETCPDGYTVGELPQPEKPWYIKLLDALDKWFGLKGKVIWMPTAGQLAFVAGLVLVLRRLLQLFQVPFIDNLTHGVGTLVISALVSFITTVQPLLDGGLTLYEAALALLATVAGAAGIWETLKRLVRR